MLKKTLSSLRRAVYRLQSKTHVHFLHVRKTGGTAIRHAFLTSETESASIRHAPKEYSKAIGQFVLHLHSHGTRLVDIPEGEKVFFFLRDPVARFISGFYCRQRQGQPRYFFPWSVEEKQVFTCFKTPNELGIALSSENDHERKKAEIAMKSIKHLRFSYWDWFSDEAYFISRKDDIFFVGFQETLSDDFELLKLKLKLPKTLELTKNNIDAHKSSYDAGCVPLEKLAIKNVKNWYERDYKFIKLCKDLRIFRI